MPDLRPPKPKVEIVGTCGLVLEMPCFPDIEDDLCVVCGANGYGLQEDEEVVE